MEITIQEARKLFNVAHLAEVTGISYQRLDKNFKGDSQSLTSDEKQKIHATILKGGNNLLNCLNSEDGTIVSE